MLFLFLCMQSWHAYLDSSLAYIGLTAHDIALRSDYALQDPYRFPLVEEMLQNPLVSYDTVLALEHDFWECSEPTLLARLAALYTISVSAKAKPFIPTLNQCYGMLERAFQNMPCDIVAAFEELNRFSPELTRSLEEERTGRTRSDSLVLVLQEQGTRIDYHCLYVAGTRILEAALSYETFLENLETTPQHLEGVEGTILYYEQSDFGEIVIGDTGTNIYDRDFAVIIDCGGDDVYRLGREHQRIHIVIDRAGNDTYEGEDFAIACGTFGVSIVIDEDGDDSYHAHNFSCGAAVFGVGFLLDKRGNDRYYGDTFTQGAGGFGIGIIKDEEGNDVYEGALYAQGFASTYGIGILGDRTGNDMYVIQGKYTDEIRYLDHYVSLSQGCTIGIRPDLSAGIGMLFEGSGNDYYIGDIFAQGTGYWYGIGALVDDSGNDSYCAYQYAQGSGVHIALGLLIDKTGNDSYVAKGVSQGCGHDLSYGLLYDGTGDDSYVAFDLSQGAGNANGIGMLIDVTGDDGYVVKRTHNTQGYGDFRREYGSIGVLMDCTGLDSYTSTKNKMLWKKGTYGIGIDWE